MNPAHLVCASCSHPVAEGRCPACRSAREQLRRENRGWSSPAVIVGLVLVAVLLTIYVMSQ